MFHEWSKHHRIMTLSLQVRFLNQLTKKPDSCCLNCWCFSHKHAKSCHGKVSKSQKSWKTGIDSDNLRRRMTIFNVCKYLFYSLSWHGNKQKCDWKTLNRIFAQHHFKYFVHPLKLWTRYYTRKKNVTLGTSL